MFAALVLLHIVFPSLGLMPTGAFVLVAVFAVGVWLRLRMRYPSSDFPPSDVMTCLSDVYASPVRGKPVSLSGAAIGRGTAGYILSEDMMFRDRSGLIFLNYESGIPIFGNLYFAWKKVETLIDQPATAKGWFLRGVTHHLELTRFEAAGQVIKSRVFMWSAIGAVFAIVLGVIIGIAAGAASVALGAHRTPPAVYQPAPGAAAPAPRGK